MRRIAAFSLAAVLTLATAASAFAGTATTTTTTTATVVGTISLSGIPSSYAFGSGSAGDTLTGPTFSIVVTSSDVFQVHVSALDMVSGADSISGHLVFFSNGVSQGYAPGASLLISDNLSPVSEHINLNIPAGQHSGSYVGTLTWTASD